MSIEKTGETYLNSRLDYAKGVLGLLIDNDKVTAIAIVEGDIARFERMLGEEYEKAANLDHMTDRGGI